MRGNLLATKTAVSDGVGNQFSAVGYLKFALAADVDLGKLAGEHSSELWYVAETCETHIKINVWQYLIPSGENSYVVLAAYKDVKGGSYNFGVSPEDICIAVGIGSMIPVTNTRSNTV